MRLRDDPRLWRARAEEARVAADQMTTPLGRETLEKIANCYDQLAADAERRLSLRDEAALIAKATGRLN